MHLSRSDKQSCMFVMVLANSRSLFRENEMQLLSINSEEMKLHLMLVQSVSQFCCIK